MTPGKYLSAGDVVVRVGGVVQQLAVSGATGGVDH
jgi:hypothetical protein